MVITFDMTTGAVRRQAAESDSSYGEEVLCAGWNPTLAELHAQLALQEHATPRTPADASMPATLAEGDVEDFLTRMSHP